MTIRVEVEEALGPGVDFEARDGDRAFIGRQARAGTRWTGFDRAAVEESDDGQGRRLPIVVAVPASTFVGARLEIDLLGGWQIRMSTILVGQIPGFAAPSIDAAASAAGLDGQQEWLTPETAHRAVLRARQRFRERASHARIRAGRAWYAIDEAAPELARFGTPHSYAEYSLRRLPARFVRGLEGLLDDEERLLYWVERPILLDTSVIERLQRRVDRRAALLALTDRQLLWIVDHAKPDVYLSDWGVDVELIPVERVVEVECSTDPDSSLITVTTPGGSRGFRLPAELRLEVAVMRDLLARFRPEQADDLPRRTYPLEVATFDPEIAKRYGQEAEARALFEEASAHAAPIAFTFSPRRPGQRAAEALALSREAVYLLGRSPREAALSDVATISETLSPLVGKISIGRGVQLTYPSPLVEDGARFVRMARRALAMTGQSGAPVITSPATAIK